MDGGLEADEIEDTDAAVKIDEVGAAAEEDVLTVVELLAGLGIFEGTGAATEATAGFEEGDGCAGVFEGECGGHPGEAATDDDDAGHLARTAFQPMRSLAQRESDTRSW